MRDPSALYFSSLFSQCSLIPQGTYLTPSELSLSLSESAGREVGVSLRWGFRQKVKRGNSDWINLINRLIVIWASQSMYLHPTSAALCIGYFHYLLQSRAKC